MSVRDFSFSVYSKDQVEFSVTKKMDIPVNFLNRIFFNWARVSDIPFKNAGYNLFIKKLNVSNSRGYGFLYLENKNPDKVVYFNMAFLKSKNIASSWPFQTNKPSLILKPNQKDIIVYETVSDNYVSQIQYALIVNTFDPNFQTLVLKNRVLSSQKSYKGNPIQIKEYVFNHKRGLVLQVENHTDYFVLSQSYQFQLENCYLLNNNESEYELICRPGETVEIIIQKKHMD